MIWVWYSSSCNWLDWVQICVKRPIQVPKKSSGVSYFIAEVKVASDWSRDWARGSSVGFFRKTVNGKNASLLSSFPFYLVSQWDFATSRLIFLSSDRLSQWGALKLNYVHFWSVILRWGMYVIGVWPCSWSIARKLRVVPVTSRGSFVALWLGGSAASVCPWEK